MELNEQPVRQAGSEPLAAAPDPAAAENSAVARRGIAPVWHTVMLILTILLVSALGVHRHVGANGSVAINRLSTYGTTGALELVLIGWVALGVKLRGIPLRSLFGRVSISLKAIMVDFGIAVVFWIFSMMALGSVAMLWMSIESLITHKSIPIQTSKGGQPMLPQDQATKAVVQLAPTNGKEIAGWLLLCMLVGIAEELVFRGYLQSQFIAWSRGTIAAGVVFSSLMFGAAHGYEGVRAMFLLSVFGALFSGLALLRKNLRAGIFAHAWHDAVAGLTVAFLHSRHIL